MPSGRRDPKEMDKARKAIADILTYHKDKIKFVNGHPAPLSVVRVIKTIYDIDVTRQFVHKVITEGEYGHFVDTLCMEDNPKIMELKDALATQQMLWKDATISPKERTMASNAWRAIQKQLIDYERDIADIKIKETEASRPVYLIKFIPPSVAVTCPKCGNIFYDVRSDEDVKATSREVKRVEREKEERGEGWKPFYSVDVKEQNIFDNFGENENEKNKEKDERDMVSDTVEDAIEQEGVSKPSDRVRADVECS
jgi:hypothetical protein